ncbi:FAD-dependent oxidoreductase [Micromonospora sp. WMMD736]|uniref:FAD-dependent oxidoreductase n=1 Tax=Micromonospora sp. WMMD736 TaxID=3404112 RepID=UPI003B95B34F
MSPEEWCTAGQSGAEQASAERAHELGAELRFGTRLVGLAQDADGVTAHVEEADTGRRYRIRAGYVVAADGWRSPVREALGIPLQGRGVVGQVLRVLFKADLSEPLAHTPGAADSSRFAAFHIGRAVLFNTEIPDCTATSATWRPSFPKAGTAPRTGSSGRSPRTWGSMRTYPWTSSSPVRRRSRAASRNGSRWTGYFWPVTPPT